MTTTLLAIRPVRSDISATIRHEPSGLGMSWGMKPRGQRRLEASEVAKCELLSPVEAAINCTGSATVAAIRCRFVAAQVGGVVQVRQCGYLAVRQPYLGEQGSKAAAYLRVSIL